MKYLPFLNGYTVAPGLIAHSKAKPGLVQNNFAVDEHYAEYISNKTTCRSENMRKYYLTSNLLATTAAVINQYVAQQLVAEHPEHFSLVQQAAEWVFTNKITGTQLCIDTNWQTLVSGKYTDVTDALAAQVQEDIAFCQLEDSTDWLAALHICAPNYWSPGKKIGKPFNAVHAAVPGMEKAVPHNFKMLQTIVSKGPYIRFAWGITTDNRLNHHPEPPPNVDPVYWQGRQIDGLSPLYCRVEKQTLIGFKDVNAFLFLIRTYFYSVTELTPQEKLRLLKAVEGMNALSLEYKGLTGKKALLRKMLISDLQ